VEYPRSAESQQNNQLSFEFEINIYFENRLAFSVTKYYNNKILK